MVKFRSSCEEFGGPGGAQSQKRSQREDPKRVQKMTPNLVPQVQTNCRPNVGKRCQSARQMRVLLDRIGCFFQAVFNQSFTHWRNNLGTNSHDHAWCATVTGRAQEDF